MPANQPLPDKERRDSQFDHDLLKNSKSVELEQADGMSPPTLQNNFGGRARVQSAWLMVGYRFY